MVLKALSKDATPHKHQDGFRNDQAQKLTIHPSHGGGRGFQEQGSHAAFPLGAF